jgi:hypothetical protein
MKLLLLLLLATALTSQDADVVAVTPEESVRAKAAYQHLRDALKEWETVNQEMRDKYIIVPCILNQTTPNPQAGNPIPPVGRNRCLLVGFNDGHKFTRDFKHLVPDLKPGPDSIYQCWKIK